MEYRTGIEAMGCHDRLDREAVEAFALVLDAAPGIVALRAHLRERRVRERFRAALAEAAPSLLAEALERLRAEAPPDRFGFAPWLARLLEAARRERPGLDLFAYLDESDLEGEDRERHGAVFDSTLLASYLVQALSRRPAAGAARAVLEVGVPFRPVPGEVLEFFRALGEPGWPALAAALFDDGGDPPPSATAAEVLTRLQIEPAVRLLDALDPDVRTRVAEAFGRGRYEDSLVRLARAGVGAVREVARAAARAVREIGGANAGPLVDLLASPYPEVRADAEEGLAGLGGEAAPALRRRLEGLGVAPDATATTDDLRRQYGAALEARRAHRIEVAIAETGDHLQAGRFAEALDALGAIERIEADHQAHLPLVGRASFELGRRRLAENDASGAALLLRRARRLHLDPAAVRIPLYRAERAVLVEVLTRGEPVDLDGEEVRLAQDEGPAEAKALVADALDRAAAEWESRGRLDRAVELLDAARERHATPDIDGHLARVLLQEGLRVAEAEGPAVTNASFDRLLGLDWAAEERRRVADWYAGRAGVEIEARRWDAARERLDQAARFDPQAPAFVELRRRMWFARHGLVGAALAALGLATLLAARGTRP